MAKHQKTLLGSIPKGYIIPFAVAFVLTIVSIFSKGYLDSQDIRSKAGNDYFTVSNESVYPPPPVTPLPCVHGTCMTGTDAAPCCQGYCVKAPDATTGICEVTNITPTPMQCTDGTCSTKAGSMPCCAGTCNTAAGKTTGSCGIIIIQPKCLTGNCMTGNGAVLCCKGLHCVKSSPSAIWGVCK